MSTSCTICTTIPEDTKMIDDMNLAEARKHLPELADKAYAGQTFILARRGRKLAALIGIEEYNRLVELEREQRRHDFDILLAPSNAHELTEEDARELAVRAVREIRGTS